MFIRSYLRKGFCFIVSLIIVEEYGCTHLEKNENDNNDMAIEDDDYFDDYPAVNDASQYLKSLIKVIGFGMEHRTEIDMNLAFGFSVATDNLSHVLMRKGAPLPINLKLSIEDILKYNSEILTEFETMLALSKNNTNIMLLSLFSNRTLGTEGIEDFHQKKMSPSIIAKKPYPSWEIYFTKVHQIERWTPSPREGDKCLLSLAKNKFNRRVCKMKSTCKIMLMSGTNFGYSLAQRLLILLQAYRGRGCRIFSVREDRKLLDKICVKIFREANYIAENKFELLNLLVQQMTLCSLAGYMDTLRRSWLAEMMKHQTPFGCFTPTLPEANKPPWQIAHTDTNILGRACDGHWTAVAAGALSGAIRYVLEKNY